MGKNHFINKQHNVSRENLMIITLGEVGGLWSGKFK
jgi:hypothetical protein